MTDVAFCENCGTDRDQYGQLERRLFHRCASCRLEVCPDCWNRGRDLCLNCAPFAVGLAGAGQPTAPAAATPPAAAPEAAPAPAAGWALVAPDDSPDAAPAWTPPMALTGIRAPEAAAAAASARTEPSWQAQVGRAASGGVAALGSLAGTLGRPLRLATHAVLLLCVTTLGLLVTWQLVSFVGTARPMPGSDGSAAGAPTATASSSLDPVTAAATPQAVVSPGSRDDRGPGGGDPRGGGTPRPTSHPTATPGGSPTDEPTSTPTDPPTPTDTPTAAPTDTPPPPTDTPAPPTDTPAPPTDTPGP